MQKTYIFQLDVKDQLIYPKMSFVQGDIKSNSLVITLTNEGKAIDLTNKTTSFTFKNSDGYLVVAQGTIIDEKNGKVTHMLCRETLSVAGRVDATIEVYNSEGARITTNKFYFTVKESLSGDPLLISEHEFPILSQLMQEINLFKARIDLDKLDNQNQFNAIETNIDQVELNHLDLVEFVTALSQSIEILNTRVKPHNEGQAEQVLIKTENGIMWDYLTLNL